MDKLIANLLIGRTINKLDSAAQVTREEADTYGPRMSYEDIKAFRRSIAEDIRAEKMEKIRESW